MEGIGLILAVAVLVEGLTQYVKEVVASNKEVKIAYVISLVAGIGLTLVFQAQFFTALGLKVVHPVIDMILTGIILSRGSNYVHDLITRLGGNKIVSREVVTKTEIDTDIGPQGIE